MMQKLSVVIITLNEERNIGRCIESVHGLAEEVVVVDSLSTDRTREIAIGLGAKVVEQPFLGHIEQKNFAIEQASFDWVLSLDADEALSQELHASIKAQLAQPTHDGYAMNRLTNYCGAWIKHSGWYPDTKLRLFKKGKGAWTGTNPHDRFDLFPGGSKGILKGDILHYSFYTLEEHDQQIAKFTDISAQAKWAKGVRSNYLKVAVKPMAKFMKCYFIKRGFLDGYYGWVIAVKSARASYLKYRKLLAVQQSVNA